MWLSRQMKPGAALSGADLGVTTISGKQVGVVTRGEARDLPVYGPGGYLWTPANGAAVLVVRGGPGGEERCVAGTRPAEAPAEIKPGEVYLYGPGGNAVYLREDGSVELTSGGGGGLCLRGDRVDISGRLTVNGRPYAPGQD